MSSEINKSKLDSLENDRQLLVDQLLAKSVQADTSETMTSLVGKVNTIVTGELEPDPYVAPSHTFNMYYDDRTTYNTALSIFDSAYEPYISWVLGQVENYCVRDVCPGILSLHLKSSYSFTPNKTSLRYFCSYLPYLTSLTIDRGFLPSTITDMEGFLSACDSLVEVDLRNLDVLKSEEVKENEEIKKTLNKSIRKFYEEYINSVEFKIDEINRLRKKEMNDDYIKRYIYLANHFIEFLLQ